ncbi:MAG: NADH-quinone oxidoreductase subunit NuoG [Solirubrobacteraceae bacterium]
MPRPEVKMVTFSIDGREVTAPENIMLVDGALYGDVDIPVFCYERKLGQPVGACRMCLVEIEGIPKLQTACSTPVKDGMVVVTQSERVQIAQRSVVEFLLINHPLDCPVCDKGGECPLQDITYGWGPGTTRFIEPKRHFRKPLELSPLIAIDRERCILCYRCVRFSQEVSEDYQLVLQERGAHSYVSTFDGTPYVAPFSGNITELCPVGALTSSTYRFRARPWEIEGAGSVCALCPSQCNVELTVRDDKVMRVLSREHPEVDDGWLCDKGRYAFQYTHSDERIVTPLVREGIQLMPVTWETAMDAARAALKKGNVAALAGGETTNEEAFLAAKLFDRMASSPAPELPAALYSPGLQAKVPDLEFAHTVLLLDTDPVDAATIWDLRIRKGVRRRGVHLAIASARPTSLDANAAMVVRHAPGALEALLVGLDAALAGDDGNLGGGAAAAGSTAAAVRGLAEQLADGGEDVVIVAGERCLTPGVATALLNISTRLGLEGRDGAGLLIAPFSANGRGLREVGFAGDAAAIRDEPPAVLYLLHADPLAQYPDRDAWEAVLSGAQTVIAHESVMTETIREYADVVFPAEAYPEKDGTLTHPDGRVQRLRPAIGRAGEVRATWRVLSELAGAPLAAGALASKALFEEVYPGLTLDAISGRGAYPERATAPAWELASLSVPDATPPGLRYGSFRTVWAAKEVGLSPVLRFARPEAAVEMSPVDAQRLGVQHGEEVEVTSNGHVVRGPAVLRAALPTGSVFLPEGVEGAPANLITAATVEVRGTRELVGAPAAVGASSSFAENVSSEKPTEQQLPDAGGVGSDGTLPAEDAGDL